MWSQHPAPSHRCRQHLCSTGSLLAGSTMGVHEHPTSYLPSSAFWLSAGQLSSCTLGGASCCFTLQHFRCTVDLPIRVRTSMSRFCRVSAVQKQCMCNIFSESTQSAQMMMHARPQIGRCNLACSQHKSSDPAAGAWRHLRCRMMVCGRLFCL